MRSTTPLEENWKFTRGDPEGAEKIDFDDRNWQTVEVPHDWAIAGPFDRENDIQVTTVMEDGEKKPAERTGRTGALPHVGTAWYRLKLDIPGGGDARLFLEFDGVMSRSTVFFNGQRVGERPYGYISFNFEVTDFVRFGQTNVLAVRVDNPPDASRWYPGAGIYRNVRLVKTASVRIAPWGVKVATPEISSSSARVIVSTHLDNRGKTRSVSLRTAITGPRGETVCDGTVELDVSNEHTAEGEFAVADPSLWDVFSPDLYTVVSEIILEGEPVDRCETVFGIRTAEFHSKKGFSLNGRPMKLNGVCMHHDLGPLGAAVNGRALERQCEILRDMGCNALRTSHNPPAPEVLYICDRMGILVIDEAFDEWRTGKCENGYHTLFDKWAERDMRDFIRRDRNHPCVIMWSIGNEVREQAEGGGASVARFLAEICREEDPARPVTAGFNNSDEAIANGIAAAVDVPGWNYKPFKYEEYHAAYPDWPMYGSETESCVSTRDEYHFPVREIRDQHMHHESLQVSSYDMCSPGWGYAPDVEFAAQDKCPFIFGEFVWTGFDYLGEPTPYNRQWPSRSSYFGIVDLCGLPKDRYYLYRSKWNRERSTLHILPHWNWEGREGENVPVHCYTSYPAAELFVNGRSHGMRKKVPGTVYDTYRLRWNEVKYEPGVIKVVAMDSRGTAVEETETRTAGPASRIQMSADISRISADGRDLCFITVSVTDDAGCVCPHASDTIEFGMEGPARLAGVGNGDPTSLESFVEPRRKAFHGKCVLIVRSVRGNTGSVRVTASGEGLRPAELAISAE
ncbi:MAG: beta-galactosidase GalB [Kiritimatiellia bacterium]